MTLALPPGRRVYAIGDIHGCPDMMDAMLALIDEDAARDPAEELWEIFLGDFVDRGPDSAGVIDRLVSGPPEGRHRVCLMGNHEEAMLQALEDGARMDYWLELGGDATVRSYGVEPREQLGDGEAVRRLFVSALPAAHRRFITRLPRCHRIGNVLFAHAGIRPGVALDAQNPHDLVWIREGFLDHSGDLEVHVIHGHTPVDAPDIRRCRTNVDTGAVYGGALTAVVLEGDEMRFLSVPAG